MSTVWAQIQHLLSRAERWPFLDRLQPNTRRGLLVGAAVAAALFLLLGAVLGGLNRGVAGIFIGGLSAALSGILFGGLTGAILGTLLLSPDDSARLAIELDDTEGRYVPGDTITGQLVLSAGGPTTVRGGQVTLLCRGYYAHDPIDGPETDSPPSVTPRESRMVRSEHLQETKVYATLRADVVPAGTLRRGGLQSYPFSFALPRETPPTHHGYLCAIKWELHGVVELGERTPLKVQRELYVEALPPLDKPISQIQAVAPNSLAQLTLTLSRGAYAEGETLRGQIKINPLDWFNASEVRAVLLRIENTPEGEGQIVYIASWDPATGLFRAERRPGNGGTTYVWLEGEAPLSGATEFKPSELVTHAFAIDIPNQWRPTLDTDEGRVAWRVGIVLHREDQPNLQMLQEITVHTCDKLPESTASSGSRSGSTVRGRR